MSVQSSSGSLEGPPSWSQLSTSPTPGSAAAARSLLNHTPPSGRPREGKCRRARARSRASPPVPGPRDPPVSSPRPRGGGWWRGGREAARLRGGSTLAVGGGSRVATETDEGLRAGWRGRGEARRTDSSGVLRSQSSKGRKPPPGREPLSAPFASTLSTLNLLASGLWWVFPPVEAFILEPPPLPSRTPPIEAVLAVRALLLRTWRMSLGCRVFAL